VVPEQVSSENHRNESSRDLTTSRRAKIKRLTADDRDRMIKMRAVPDDFDNVQALHSPYGAVHTMSAPITPPVEFGAQSYAEHMMRPLMLDTIRRGDGDQMSPTGLSPSFPGIGFSPSAPMSTPDILSPLSATSNDRNYYSSHLGSPLSSGPRTSNPFARQSGGLEVPMQSRQQIRPLQPLQLRETMTRSRSDNLQSPLRSSMSWKGDSIDYAYPSGSTSPAIGGRHQSMYQGEQGGATSGSGLNYDSGSYSTSASIQSSPTHINYSSLNSATLQPPQNSRLRAATATLPLGLDLRTQYRSVSSGHNLPATGHSTPRATSATPYTTTYTTSFPSAPLTAPIDFTQPRTAGIRSAHDYSMPQMSAPIAPPPDFTQALHANMSAPSTRTPMRDSFAHSQSPTERAEEFGQDSFGGLKRKRSYSSGPNTQAYSHAS
jgi:hypothetical protein